MAQKQIDLEIPHTFRTWRKPQLPPAGYKHYTVIIMRIVELRPLHDISWMCVCKHLHIRLWAASRLQLFPGFSWGHLPALPISPGAPPLTRITIVWRHPARRIIYETLMQFQLIYHHDMTTHNQI